MFDDLFNNPAVDMLIPLDGGTYIQRWNDRFVIARCHDLGDGAYTWEHCLNWQALEAAATKVVLSQRDGLSIDMLYPCPEALTARAVWPAIKEMPGILVPIASEFSG
jgi:hypothetical protein